VILARHRRLERSWRSRRSVACTIVTNGVLRNRWQVTPAVPLPQELQPASRRGHFSMRCLDQPDDIAERTARRRATGRIAAGRGQTPGTIRSPEVVESMGHLQRQLSGRLLIVWDGPRSHRSRNSTGLRARPTGAVVAGVSAGLRPGPEPGGIPLVALEATRTA
jgi:hypothetical protein